MNVNNAGDLQRVSPGMIGAKSLFSGDERGGEGVQSTARSPESRVIADIAVIGKSRNRSNPRQIGMRRVRPLDIGMTREGGRKR
jgi:hypothetical protein